MDMKCRKCGEPWDWWYIREEILMGHNSRMDFYPSAKKHGLVNLGFTFEPGPYIVKCPACESNGAQSAERRAIMSAVADVLGDDVDGFMAEMEDLEGLV